MLTGTFADSAKVMAKGQITIPKDVREVLGVESGDRVTFIVESGSVRLVNSAVYAMQMLRLEMAGEAERAGLDSDEAVAALVKELGLPEEMVMRQPFPGPGLAVRMIGAVNKKDLDILREADVIIVEEMKKAGLYYKTWQAFPVFIPVKTVGVMGDERTYDNVIALRAVESQDGMTADWVRLPYDLMERISTRIINEVNGVNRVVYDITSKPPGTIEWE